MSSSYGRLSTIRDYWMPRNTDARVEVRVTDLDEILRELARVTTLAADRTSPPPPARQKARYSDIVSDGGMDPRTAYEAKRREQDDEALEVLHLALDALVWEAGSEPGLYAAQTLEAVESIRALLAKRGAA